MGGNPEAIVLAVLAECILLDFSLLLHWAEPAALFVAQSFTGVGKSC